MSMVSKVGKSLINFGTRAVKIATKNPKIQKVTAGLEEKIMDVKMLMERYAWSGPDSFNHVAQESAKYIK